jgi:hypothetical protein
VYRLQSLRAVAYVAVSWSVVGPGLVAGFLIWLMEWSLSFSQQQLEAARGLGSIQLYA